MTCYQQNSVYTLDGSIIEFVLKLVIARCSDCLVELNFGSTGTC